MFGFLAFKINQGEAYIATSLNNTKYLMVGPKKIYFPFRFKLEASEKCIAHKNQHLIIKYLDGNMETIKGPSSIFKNPLIHETIKQNDDIFVEESGCVRVYKNDGDVVKGKHITGPCYYTPDADERVIKLTLQKAEPGEYLRVCYKDGRVEIINGPASILQDDIIHNKISIEKCLVLKSNECVIVYRQLIKDEEGSIQKMIKVLINGPCYYTPAANESYHTFSWHGHNPANVNKVGPGFNQKIPNALKFNVLTMTPRQIYLDVTHVRTRDDAEITACFMVFYELVDVDMMLNMTADPIGDIINSHTADVLAFVSKKTFDELKGTFNELNNLTYFPQMINTVTKRGYKITNITFRGYMTNDKLQKMHNDAIETRTGLVLERDTEKEKQSILDFKTQKIKEREIEESEIKSRRVRDEEERSNVSHKNAIERQNMTHESEITKKEMELEITRAKNAEETKHLRDLNTEEAKHFSELRELGVDLTQIIVEKERAKTNVNKMIRILPTDPKSINLQLVEKTINE